MLTKKNTSRFVISATGKNGETYLTTCKNKQEVKQWVKTNYSKLNPKELKIVDKHKKLFWVKSFVFFATALFVLFELWILM